MMTGKVTLNRTQNDKEMYIPKQAGRQKGLSPPQPQWHGCLSPQEPAPARLGGAPPLQGSGTTFGRTHPSVHHTPKLLLAGHQGSAL